LISPYTAPASTFTTEAMTQSSMRWHGAVYFAFIPTLFMVFMQASEIYSASRFGPIYWTLKVIEPFLMCAPLCLLMAGTGYAVAIRCSGRSIGSALLVGCAVGAGWALVVIVGGNTIAQLNGATPITLERVIRMLVVIPSIFIPLGVVLCIFTRWRGNTVRLGQLGKVMRPYP
jgi:hypothetical protein